MDQCNFVAYKTCYSRFYKIDRINKYNLHHIHVVTKTQNHIYMYTTLHCKTITAYKSQSSFQTRNESFLHNSLSLTDVNFLKYIVL